LAPSFSPDGTQVVYVWDGERHDNFDIYAGGLAGEPPVRLTRNSAPDHSPAWAPDGSSIAFLRQIDAEQASVWVVPARGGAERKLSEFATPSWLRWDEPGKRLAWSHDSKWLLAVGRQEPNHVNALFRLAVATGEKQLLISPSSGSLGDTGPAVSPDGKTLAFSRRLSWSVSELCLLPLAPDLMPAGDVRRVSTGSSWNTSPAWTPDGDALIFSTGAVDAPHLARILVSRAGLGSRLSGVGDHGFQPSIARTAAGGLRLIYTQHFESVNLWRQTLDGARPAVQLIGSAHWSFEPDYSPDGKHIAFLSARSGNMEIWVADADGSQPRRWTFLGQPSLGAPRWCPQSRRIAFTAPGADGSSIYVVEEPGVAPQVVPGSHRCGYLAWARDGNLYFSSNRGSTQIWRIGPEGGQAVQLTTQGGRAPTVSADGRYLYYLRLMTTAGDQQLFRVPMAGGNEEKVLDFVDTYSLGNSGIAFKYYRPGGKPEGPYLRFLRFATGRTEELRQPAKPLRYGIALSPDGEHVLYSQADYTVTDLMLVDRFR
jgi:Tol biopolymer transport system component